MGEREDLLARIVKGAEYIDKIGRNHPNYTSAMNKYDRLCGDLFQMDKRR
jgi:hypothetical protein